MCGRQLERAKTRPKARPLSALFLHHLPPRPSLHPCRPQVIARANNSPYGLAAGVFSNNIDTVNTLTRALKSGTVWVNCYNLVRGGSSRRTEWGGPQ